MASRTEGSPPPPPNAARAVAWDRSSCAGDFPGHLLRSMQDEVSDPIPLHAQSTWLDGVTNYRAAPGVFPKGMTYHFDGLAVLMSFEVLWTVTPSAFSGCCSWAVPPSVSGGCDVLERPYADRTRGAHPPPPLDPPPLRPPLPPSSRALIRPSGEDAMGRRCILDSPPPRAGGCPQ